MNRAVIITGGGSGMGRCMCRYFAERSWNVCIADINNKGTQQTAEEISFHVSDTPVKSFSMQKKQHKKGGLLAVKMDVCSSLQVRETVERCVKRFGRIDALVNNAGVTDQQTRNILNIPYDTLREIISVNVMGSFTCLRECAAVMMKNSGGNIVNITSLLAQRGYARAGVAAYGISKAALEALTEYAAIELGEGGINVNSAFPGVMVNTGFFDHLEEQERVKLADPAIMNELVYILCCLEPGSLTGRSFSYQNWKKIPELSRLYQRYLADDTLEGTI